MIRLSVGQRIAASFAILILPVALIAIFFVSRQVSFYENVQYGHVYDQAENKALGSFNQVLHANLALQSAVNLRDKEQTLELLGRNTFAPIQNGISWDLVLPPVPNYDQLTTNFETYIDEARLLHQELFSAVNEDDWVAADRLVDQLLVQANDLKGHVDFFVTTSNQIQATELSNRSPIQNQVILLPLFAFGGIILLILAIGLIQTFTIAIPMSQLRQSLNLWQSGDLSHRAEIWGQSEIHQIGEMMNETVDLIETGRSRFQDPVDTEHASSQDLLNDRIFGLETSLAIAQYITSIPDLGYVLPRVVELLRQRYNLYHVAIFLFDDQTDLLMLESGALIDDKRTLPINEKSMPGWAALKRRPGLSEDVTQDDRYYPSTKLPKTRSELALPLIVGNELHGVLDLHSDSFSDFNRNSVLQFQSIADLIAMAVRNVRMIEGGQERSYLADALKEIGMELSATANLNDIFDLMLSHTNRLVEFDGAAVLVWNGKMLEVRATFGDCVATKGMKITPDANDPSDIFVRIQEAGRPYTLDRPEAMDIKNKWHALFLEGSWMAIPFIGKSNVAGIVSFSRNLLEPFSTEDRALATTITNQSWLVLENTLLQQRTKRIQEQMEFELHSRTEAIQLAYSELEKLDETKSKFVTIASHELKTPLTIIRGYGEILQKYEKNSGENPHNLRIIEGILKGVHRINELVENLLDLSRIDYRTLEIKPEPIRLKDLLAHVRSGVEEDLALRNLQLQIGQSISRLPIVDADLIGLRKVFEHLINNAIKYTPDGGSIQIKGRSWMGGAPQLDWPDDGVHIQICDTGIGVNPADQELIFQKFFQIGEVDLHSTSKVGFRGGGPGLGLAIVRGIVTAHNGLVWAESEGQDLEKYPGTVLNIVLPRRQKWKEKVPNPNNFFDDMDPSFMTEFNQL